MKIELKNIKHSAFASHETNCFEASVYIDGLKAGKVSNGGYGGCHEYHPSELALRLNAYANTLPPVVTDMNDPREMAKATLGLPQDTTKKFTYKQDADSVIDELVTDHLYSRDLKRRLAKRVLTLEKGAIYETSALNKLQMTNYLEKLKQTNETWQETILNLMPFEKALTIYREGVNHA